MTDAMPQTEEQALAQADSAFKALATDKAERADRERIRANASAYTQGRKLAKCEVVDGPRSIPALWLFYTGGHHVLCSGTPDNFYMGAPDSAFPEQDYPEGSLYRPATPEQARQWLSDKGYSSGIIAALLR